MEQIQFQNPFEKMANSRISKMDFLTFMELISTYKTLNMFDQNNPLYMYICYFVPYTPKINQKQKKLLFQNNLNYASMTNAIRYLTQMRKMNKYLDIKEKTIRFNLRNCKNLQRFQKVEIKLRNDEYNKTIIKIQKHIRGFLKRISIIRIIDYFVIEKLLSCILKIQKYYRRFAYRRDFKVNHLIKLILEDRNKKSDKIKEAFYSYKSKLESKKKLFINAVLKERNEKILFLQGFFKARFSHNNINQLLLSEKSKYILTYPHYAKKVQLKLFFDHKLKVSKIFDFEYCSIRKMFLLKINHSDVKPGKYFVQFIVDNYINSDDRYPLVEGKDGHYYNIIEFLQKGQNPYGSTNTIHTSINVTGTDSSNNNSLDSPQLVSNKKFPFYNNYNNNNIYNQRNSYFNNNYDNNNFYNYNGFNNFNNYNYGNMYQKPNYGRFTKEEEFISSLKSNLQGKSSEFSNEFSNVD